MPWIPRCVGNVLGDTALAAIGACGAIYELLVGFGIGIGNGLAIVAARPAGPETSTKLKQTVAGSIVIGIIASAVITLAGAAGLHPLLELLDTPAEILADAYGYIIIIDLGVIVMFAYNLCAGLLRAIGNSFMPLVFLHPLVGTQRHPRPLVHRRAGHGRGRCRCGDGHLSGRVRWRSASCMSSAAPGCSCPGKSTSSVESRLIGSCSARASPWAS
ncbi:MAG: MATE family efflux transporter [Faecalibacterium prausnitzii]